jgi:hypothetical protein
MAADEEQASNGPKWIRDAAAFIALISAIVGTVLSVYGLLEKSRLDRQAAADNLKIANLKATTDLSIGGWPGCL